MSNTETIKKLKLAVIAYKAAEDFDRCPSSDETLDVMNIIGYTEFEVIQSLDEHEGRRPDEIANTICNLVDQL